MLLSAFILCWTSLGIAHSYNLDYRELQQLGVSCPPKDSCRRRSYNGSDLMSCECDPLCGRRGTCCIDAWYLTPSRKPIEACVSIYDPYNRDIYMVSKCSSDWSGDPNTASRCASANSFGTDPIERVPVTAASSQITYRNYFCSQCNNYKGRLIFWNLRIFAYFRPGEVDTIDRDRFFDNLELDEGGWWQYRLKNETHGDRMIGMDFGYYPPDSIEHLIKKCGFGIQSTCSDTWPDDEVKAKCGEYMALVYMNNKRGYPELFRNVHCGICNNFTVQNTSCGVLSSLIRPDSNSEGPVSEAFDIALSDGSDVGRVRCCPQGQIIDPFNGRKSTSSGTCANVKCRPISCRRRGYVIRNFRCVPSR